MGVACALLQQLQALSLQLANPANSRQEGTCSFTQGESNSECVTSSPAKQTALKLCLDNLAAALQLLSELCEEACQSVAGSVTQQQLDQLSFAVQVAESALRLLARGSGCSTQQQKQEHAAAGHALDTDVQNVQDQQQKPHGSSIATDPLAADKAQLAAATSACTHISNAAVAAALHHINASQQQPIAAADIVQVPLATAVVCQHSQQVPGSGLQQAQQLLLQAVLSLVLTVTKVQQLTVPASRATSSGSSQHAGSSSHGQGIQSDLGALLFAPADACMPVSVAAGHTFMGPFGACGLMAHAGYVLGYMSVLVQHYRTVHSASKQVVATSADAGADAAAAAAGSRMAVAAAKAQCGRREAEAVAWAVTAAAQRLLSLSVASPLPIANGARCTPAACVSLGRCLTAIAVELQEYALEG
jgi:hypothetical protein